jgi:hypothetical protein
LPVIPPFRLIADLVNRGLLKKQHILEARKSSETQINLGSGDFGNYTVVREHNGRILPSKDTEVPRSQFSLYGLVSQASRNLELNLKALHREPESERMRMRKLCRIAVRPRHVRHNAKTALGSKIIFRKYILSLKPCFISRDHPARIMVTRISRPVSHQHKRTSSNPKYFVGIHSDEPQSPDFACPRSGPEWSENSSFALSLSPRSCSSSLAPSQFHSDQRVHSAQSSNKRAQRTPLPTKKSSNSARYICEGTPEHQLAMQQTPMIRCSSPTESTALSRYPFADRPADMNLKRKRLDSRCVSSESIYADSSASKTLGVGGNHSSYRSADATSSCDFLSPDATTDIGARPSPSMAASADYPGTPPKKRPTLEDNRARAQGSGSTTHNLVSSSLIALASELVDRSQDSGKTLVKRRGSNLSNVDRSHTYDSSSITSSSDQTNLTKNPKRDNVADNPPRQLLPHDHTLCIKFQSPKPAQLYARASSGNQLADIEPRRHHTLPSRPSITPPLGASSHPPPRIIGLLLWFLRSIIEQKAGCLLLTSKYASSNLQRTPG